MALTPDTLLTPDTFLTPDGEIVTPVEVTFTATGDLTFVPEEVSVNADLVFSGWATGAAAPEDAVLAGSSAGSQDRRPQVMVLLRAADGDWLSVGTAAAAGVFPEQVTTSANESGPDTCSFVLRRRPGLGWPDLTAFNQAEILIDGSPVWGGRIWEAPLSSGGEDVIAVQGRGWQYHLDDDVIARVYAHTNLTDYRDHRQADPSSDLTLHTAGANVQASGGLIQLIWPALYTVALNHVIHIIFDAGVARLRRAVVTWERIGVSASDITLYSRGSDLLSGASGDDGTAAQSSASGTISHTFSADRRYHHVFLYYGGAGGAFGQDQGVRITSIKTFGSASWESGGVSVLTSDDVIGNVLASGAVPLLSTDTSLIAAGSFAIPDLAPNGYQTPRQLIAAANAYEGNLVGVDAQRVLFSRERDTVATVEANPTGGFAFQDATSNSAEEIYNRVVVQGTAPDGTPVLEVRTATSSLLTRQGFTRTATLNVSSAVTAAAAQVLGDVWLAQYSQPKFKGTATFQGHGSVRLTNGGGIHPSQLVLFAGRLIRIPIVDPATGAWTRDCLIKAVRYDHDSETAVVELDNERGNFATLLERYGVDVGQSLARTG
jgi:hypothetical protein